MKFYPVLTSVGILALTSLTACIDDNYDLSDIDTTTQLKVDNLTLPLNLSEIELNSIIDVDDSDPDATIQIVKINNKKYYAVVKKGDFEAKPINISQFEAPKPSGVQDIHQTISLNQATNLRKKAAGENDFSFNIQESTTDFTYNVGEELSLDNAVESVKFIKFDKTRPMTILITLKADELKPYIKNAGVRNFELIVPTGSVARFGNIESENGILTIPEFTSLTPEIVLEVELESMDFTQMPGVDSKQGIIVSNGEFSFTEKVGFKSGELVVYPKETSVTQLPTTSSFVGSFDISSFVVGEFSGKINYATEINDIPRVNLGELPDFLQGNETDLILKNPQLFISGNNPVGKYGLAAESGMTITAVRPSGKTSQVLPKFQIGESGSTVLDVLLCPDPFADDVKSEFNHSNYSYFPGMSQLISGKGIPEYLEISLSSAAQPKPRIFGEAKNFPLAESIPAILGQYEFYTPLALSDGSTIVYNDRIDGWNDEDVDKILITDLNVTFNVNTSIPFGATISVTPLDKYGNLIDNCTATAQLSAMADNEAISLTMSGDIRNLDGIYIQAIAKNFNGVALSPNQIIIISNLKAKVSGSYTTKL